MKNTHSKSSLKVIYRMVFIVVTNQDTYYKYGHIYFKFQISKTSRPGASFNIQFRDRLKRRSFRRKQWYIRSLKWCKIYFTVPYVFFLIFFIFNQLMYTQSFNICISPILFTFSQLSTILCVFSLILFIFSQCIYIHVFCFTYMYSVIF